MNDVRDDSLRIRLQLPASVRRGEDVPITLVVENLSDRRLDLHLLGRTIAFDLVVSRDDGTEVWRRMQGAVVPMILRLEPLEAGTAMELPGSWPVRSNDGSLAPPGEYTVRGELFTEGTSLLTNPARFRIDPGDP